MVKRRRLLMAAALTTVASLLFTGSALAHEEREVAGYSMVVGMIQEPVFTGQKSGLELLVTRGDQPVTGLQDTLQAQATFQGQTRDLPLAGRFGEDGWYQSFFFPTAAGAYTFRIYGTIDGEAIDESFTAAAEGEGFGEVREAQSGQFPVVLAPAAEVSADAQRGAQAADQMPLALGLSVLALIAGLAAIGLALARSRRPQGS